MGYDCFESCFIKPFLEKGTHDSPSRILSLDRSIPLGRSGSQEQETFQDGVQEGNGDVQEGLQEGPSDPSL